jgi:hypothetical protein
MNTTPVHELYLAGVAGLSLILPFVAKALGPVNAAGPKPWLRTVWTGQALGALGGLLIIFSPLYPAYGLGLAAASCALFGASLRRQVRLLQLRSA